MEMISITGEYSHTLDSKGRVLISTKLRNQIDTVEQGSNFYIVPGPHSILSLYPEKYFENLIRAGARKDSAADEAVAFERLGFALASKVEIDSQGRLLLNEKMRTRAGLKENITLIGVRDHIEIWNEQSWEQYLADHISQYQKQMTEARQKVLQEYNGQVVNKNAISI